MKNSLVSIIVPCRNEAKHIRSSLESMLAQALPDGYSLEVVVADGMSDDGTRNILHEMAKADPRLKVIDNPNKVTPSALNAAIRASGGDVLVRMDAHAWFAPDYVSQCIQTLERTQAENVGGPARAHGETYVGCLTALAFQSRFSTGGGRAHRLDYEGPVDTVWFGCWPRSTFEKVGLFDEALVRNQDDEHNLRITLSGGRVWQSPRIRSRYSTRTTVRGTWMQQFQYGYWKVRVIAKHRTAASIRHFVPGAFVAVGFIMAVLAFFSGGVAVAFLACCTTYFASSLAFALMIAARTRWSYLPGLPVIFFCYHFGYGMGFLLGLKDHFIRRHGSNKAMEALSR